LVYHILKQAGLNVGLGGNIGKSFARQVAEEQHDVYVLELSSFQLDDMFSVRLDVAVLTNITPDHLDRYNYELKNYMGSKMRITQNQTEADYFIYCADDPITQDALDLVEWKAQALPFSLEKKLHHGAWAENQEIIWKINEETNHMYRTELALRGKHNEYNSMAAGLVAKIFDIRQENLRESLSHFEGIEHRLEPVATVKGVDYINDSKATNVNSTWYALESMDKPVVWIVGGVDKGNDYEPLIPLVKDKVKAIVCLGEDVLKIHEAFRGCVETIINTGSMQEAVTMSSHFSSRGDVVLLSPCCASFDLFQNYEDRGRQFKFHVRNL
jgi:UDP-N-acetylmuramoylalanine--D-glutamate ligase